MLTRAAVLFRELGDAEEAEAVLKHLDKHDDR